MGETGTWRVDFSTAAKKQKKKLPSIVVKQLAALAWDLEKTGPIQPMWPHYSQLKKSKSIPSGSYHCHIKSGRPTYVVCWLVQDKKIKIIEIYYVGTHENAPY